MKPLLVLLGLAGLAVLTLAGLWVALPWLVGPTGPAPAPGPPLNPAELTANVQAGPADSETLRLGMGESNALLLLWTGSPSGAGMGVSSATVAFAAGVVDLRVLGQLPAGVPIGRLRGQPYELDTQLVPRVVAPGVIDLVPGRFRIGRLAVTDVVPASELLRALASRIPGAHPWWQVTGGALRLNLAQAPLLPVGQFGLRALPTALTVSPTALTITGQADAVLTLDSTMLGAALAEALQSNVAGEVPVLQFQRGVVVLTVLSGGGADTPVALRSLDIVPSIPEPGVLHLAVSGAPATDVAVLLETALGRTPPWLSVQPQGIDVDFTRVAPIEVASGVRLGFLPTEVTVDPVGVHASVHLLLAPAA